LSLTARIGELSPYLRLLRPELYYMDLTLPASSAILASYLATGGLPELLPFLIAVIGGFAAITSSYVSMTVVISISIRSTCLVAPCPLLKCQKVLRLLIPSFY